MIRRACSMKLLSNAPFFVFLLVQTASTCIMALPPASELGRQGSPAAPQVSPLRQYDFFYFVQQWQISVCNERDCMKPARPVFSIRGLWPSDASGNVHFNCTHTILSSFSPAKVSNLSTELNAEWPSLMHEDNFLLWKDEWENHATCSVPIFNQHSFFEAALKLKREYKLVELLADRGIYPFGNVYSLDSITKAIVAMTGHRPQIECNMFKNIPQLSQVFLCFDYKAIQIMDCPMRKRCHHDELLFPYSVGSSFLTIGKQ